MRGWHATRDLEAVLADGFVRPMRMPFVYVFDAQDAAEKYAAEFGYDAVVEVEVVPGSIVGRWKPSYAHGASVLRVGEPARVIGAGQVGPTARVTG